MHLQETKATCQWECSLCFREYQQYFHSVCRTAEQACITVSTCGSFLSSWFFLTSAGMPISSAQRLLLRGSFAITSQCQAPQDLPGRTEWVLAPACSPARISGSQGILTGQGVCLWGEAENPDRKSENLENLESSSLTRSMSFTHFSGKFLCHSAAGT